MENWQKRVIAEKEQLDDRIEGLAAFVASERLLYCVPDERTRLSRQLEIMREYSDILGRRIAEFPPAPAPQKPKSKPEPEKAEADPVPAPEVSADAAVEVDEDQADADDEGEGAEAPDQDGADKAPRKKRKSKKSA